MTVWRRTALVATLGATCLGAAQTAAAASGKMLFVNDAEAPMALVVDGALVTTLQPNNEILLKWTTGRHEIDIAAGEETAQDVTLFSEDQMASVGQGVGYWCAIGGKVNGRLRIIEAPPSTCGELLRAMPPSDSHQPGR